jgi:hypothetical protein
LPVAEGALADLHAAFVPALPVVEVARRLDAFFVTASEMFLEGFLRGVFEPYGFFLRLRCPGIPAQFLGYAPSFRRFQRVSALCLVVKWPWSPGLRCGVNSLTPEYGYKGFGATPVRLDWRPR